MEDELKKAEHLSHKDPERAMELLSAIGVYFYVTWCKFITNSVYDITTYRMSTVMYYSFIES